MGLDWVCFGFVFFVSWEGEIFVNLFGVKGWVGFGVLGIGFVLHNWTEGRGERTEGRREKAE